MVDNLTLDRHAMKDPSTSHLRIYVGGLTEKATIEDLYEHFQVYGQINGVVVNRQFGFVQFETESSAQDAINKANGTQLQGKHLTVRTAQQNTEKRREPEQVTHIPEVPPAVALSDNLPIIKDDGDEQYDSFGNFVGDNKYNREDEYEDYGWNESEGRQDSRGRQDQRGGVRGRAPRGLRGARGGRGRGAPGYRDRSPIGGGRGGDWSERSGYDRYPPPDYPRTLPTVERNDCEIIVVSKSLTEYAEYIEGRLKRLGIVVDLLFPMEDVPIGKVLGNIASRGCLYAILVMPQNQENRSLTLTILHGLPQEHRNMPLEDALQLMSRNFQEVQRGGSGGREAVYALLGQLADGRTLTVLQYDKIIDYIKERREQQVKIELGEPTAPATTKAQAELQQRIMSILNEKKIIEPSPAPAPAAAPAPAPPPAVDSQKKLLNDPTVRKALDSILSKFT